MSGEPTRRRAAARLAALATCLWVAVAGCRLDWSAGWGDAALPDVRGHDLARREAAPDLVARPDTRGLLPSLSWAKVPAGRFLMGSPPDESCRDADELQHQVRLSHGFEIMTTEVTAESFERFRGTTIDKPCGPHCPAQWMTWQQAILYCNALSSEAGLPRCYEDQKRGDGLFNTAAPYTGSHKIYDCRGYRLPTEAEWEYAYRAGTMTPYYTGAPAAPKCSDCSTLLEAAGKAGWYCANSGAVVHEVGRLMPNAWGLYDMAGNVQEWCQDVEVMNLAGDELDPVHEGNLEKKRVVRGGSVYTAANALRAAARNSEIPHKPADSRTGFRCVRTLD